MGKRCQVCDGPVVNGRCKYCGMPYRNDAVMYHLNEDRSEHYSHASVKVRRAMKESEIPLPDRKEQNVKKNTGKNTTISSGQSARAKKQNVCTYTGEIPKAGKKTARKSPKSAKSGKKGAISTVIWVGLACLIALYAYIPDSADNVIDNAIGKITDYLNIDLTDDEQTESSDSDDIPYTYIYTDTGTYMIGEEDPDKEEILAPGEYVAEARWEAVALEITDGSTGKEETLEFDKAGQQETLELHTGDKLRVVSLDEQYNYFAMYQIQQYDE